MEEKFEKLTQEVLRLMEAHGTGWTKPWVSRGYGENFVSQHVLQGSNAFVAMIMSSAYDWPNAWATFKQIRSVGGSVRKGEKATYFFLPFIKEDEETGRKRLFGFRAKAYFNVAQCDGINWTQPEVEDRGEILDRSAVDAFIARLGIDIVDGDPRAFYSPKEDRVHVPGRLAFTSDQAYYSTVFHELTHATAAADRVGRDLSRYHIDKQARAHEELIAELGAVFCGVELGFNPEPTEESAKYLNAWRTRIQEDGIEPVLRAAAAAQKAVMWMVDQEVAYLEERDTVCDQV